MGGGGCCCWGALLCFLPHLLPARLPKGCRGDLMGGKPYCLGASCSSLDEPHLCPIP